MKINLIKKMKFSNPIYYPDPSCQVAVGLAELIKKTTIPQNRFETLRKIGFEIEIQEENENVNRS